MNELKMTASHGDKKFDPHPEGTCMAVCRDIHIERKPNPKAGQMNQWGREEPQILVKVVFEFLTDEPIEINGQIHPRFISFKASQSWHEESNLRKFVKGWAPTIAKQDEADLDPLVGKGAYLTIAHAPGRDGTVWANIVNIAAPPKGASIPAIPETFVRHKDRPKEGQQAAAPVQTAKPTPSATTVTDVEVDDLPF